MALLARPWRRPAASSRGQALAEFALVFPMAMLVIFGIIVFGLYVFYQQQLTNVAREGARFAAIHSSGAPCPTSSWRDPAASMWTYPFHCDGPNRPGDPYPWPEMTRHARNYAWGINPATIHINACWSGHRPYGSSAAADFPAIDASTGLPNEFVQCTIGPDGGGGRINPVTDPQALACGTRLTEAVDDPASNIPGNQVTVYACFQWVPPLAGVLMLPSQITMKAVITEVIQRQQ